MSYTFRWIFFIIFCNIFDNGQLFGQVVRNIPDTVRVYTYSIKGKTTSGQITTAIDEPFLAISRDLLKNYPLLSSVKLYDCVWNGTYRVMDIMGRRHTKSVDIYYKGKRKTNKEKCLCTIVL